ncbi:MAG: enoyl-CoA hydratase-related protein [Candidatus Binatia bacterium]|nr:enoyl-CoA hydratase-related protein [Candidatus Binatia bacterium]MDG1958971.1 enoyl-CoA hydratase-related protein [Candidatus Binatia bacterium]MDG2008651.1 enoyl-CoA hydratase-related protein [Candidatus Binatia bacterium]
MMKITLADSENRNALGGELLTQFDEALDSANADPAIRAVVVTNEGNTFCAGANLKERAGAAAPSRPSISFDALLEKIQTSATPVIGQIDGHVVGGGNGLAAAFDISVAREDVKFGFTEVRLGVVPAIISVVCLPKMNRGNAMDAFLRGNRFSATRAAAMGLINYAVPGDQLESAVDEIVSDIAKGGPNAVSVAKQLVNEVPAMDQKDAFAKMAKLSAELFSGDEAKGGMRAFLKKEKAPWASEDS